MNSIDPDHQIFQLYQWYIRYRSVIIPLQYPLRCFKCDTLSKKKNCNASTIPSRAYVNHIQKNFFPRTSLEGRPNWSKIGHPGVSICRKNLFFSNNTTPVNSLRGFQERLQHFFGYGL